MGLAETHLEADEDIGKFAGPAGYPRSVASSWTRRSCGVALLGPEEMRADPWQWSPALLGRVVSAILHTRGGDVLVIMVYLDVDNFGKRRHGHGGGRGEDGDGRSAYHYPGGLQCGAPR